jgi:hypothetical protein
MLPVQLPHYKRVIDAEETDEGCQAVVLTFKSLDLH